jgi:hypothetical protein
MEILLKNAKVAAQEHEMFEILMKNAKVQLKNPEVYERYTYHLE